MTSATMTTTTTTNRKQSRRSHNNHHNSVCWRRHYNLVVALILCIITTQTWVVQARRTRGDVKLSGVNTEYVLQSFAIGIAGGRMTVRFGVDTAYPNDQNLKLRIYRDEEWPQYLKAQTCTDKIRYAHKTIPLTFNYKGDGPMVPKGGKWQAVKTLMLADPKSETERITRPHYYYFVIDDCSLEQFFQDTAIPSMFYEINTWNYYGPADKRKTTQMSADESYLLEVHEVSLFFSAVIVIWLLSNGVWRLFRKQSHHRVHMAVLWIAVAAGLDLASSVTELIHLEIYHYNGYGNYVMDAAATHLEAMCDAILMLFLLSLGAGWTLPTDVVGINTAATNTISSFLADMSKPVTALTKCTKTGCLGILVLALHAGLAQWGRIYNDDFECYHAFGHLPGRLLMALRVILGLIFLGATLQTRLHCRIKPLQRFYLVLAVLGFVWFQVLPAVTFICNWMLPFHMRHPAVFLISALLQSSSLTLLAWLVTSHATAYHQYSHMSTEEKTLTESLSAGPSMIVSPSSDPVREWKLMGKAKIRLD